MSTSIEARQARPLNFGDFKHITDVPLVFFDRDGLLFDGALTDAQIIAAWWFATSVDDADLALRQAVALKVAEAEAKPYNENTKWLTDAYAQLARYVIRYGTESP